MGDGGMSSSLDELIRIHDALEAQAYRDMLAAMPAGLASSLGVSVRDYAGATLLMVPGMPTPIFNRVIGLGNDSTVDEQVIDDIVALYRDAGIREWWLHLSPGSHNTQLADVLKTHGFVPAERKAWAKMIRSNAPITPVASAAQIGPVAANEVMDLVEVICNAFEMPTLLAPWLIALATRPQWSVVCAKVNGQIVGGGYLYQAGQSAWLGIAGVAPKARGMHVHRGLMAARIQHAIDAGCLQLYTETGEAIRDEPNPSLRNMDACGFQRAFSRLNYVAPA